MAQRCGSWRFLAFGLCALAACAQADPFPSRPVKFVAPYSAGAAPAVVSRAIAERVSKAWGQPVIVDARPGGSGFAAIDAVKQAVPDGHDLLVVSSGQMAINPALYAKLPYDPARDFVPVAMFYRTPFYLIVRANGPHASVPALIAAAKAKPGTVSYGSSYVGSPSHLGSAEFAFATGTDMIHVPYKDQSQMYVSIANGDVDWAFSSLGSALPLVTAGKIRILAVAAPRRSAALPDVPTLAEAGGPADMGVDAWLALVAPRGTPDDVVAKINADVNRAIADPAFGDLMKTLGFDAAPGTPADLAATIASEVKRFAELVRRTGARAD